MNIKYVCFNVENKAGKTSIVWIDAEVRLRSMFFSFIKFFIEVSWKMGINMMIYLRNIDVLYTNHIYKKSIWKKI